MPANSRFFATSEGSIINVGVPTDRARKKQKKKSISDKNLIEWSYDTKHSSEESDMLNSYYNEKVVGLQGVKIKNVENSEKEMRIELEMGRRTHRCPACGQQTDRIHDYRKQIVKDLNSFGKSVFLILRKRRYVCSCLITSNTLSQSTCRLRSESMSSRATAVERSFTVS